MQFQKACLQDFDRIVAFYDDLIDRTPNMGKYCLWKKRVHPSLEAIRNYLNDGAFYMMTEGEKILGALALPFVQDDFYHDVNWKTPAEEDEIAVVHILAVHPDLQGHGFAKVLLEEARKVAKSAGKKVIHLDTLETNLPGQKLYPAAGFTPCGRLMHQTPNAGYIGFYFYEYVL